MKDLVYSGQQSYRLEIVGLVRKLPVIEIAPNQWIASFVLLGDTELVQSCGRSLAERLVSWELDCLVVPEGRAVALAHVVAHQLSSPHRQMRYIVIRKAVKPYMRDPLVQVYSTITTSGQQQLVLDREDAMRLEGQRVCVLDDLISTGGTIRSVIGLAGHAGGKVCCVAVVLLEGQEAAAEPAARTGGVPVVWLGAIPMFTARA